MFWRAQSSSLYRMLLELLLTVPFQEKTMKHVLQTVTLMAGLALTIMPVNAAQSVDYMSDI